MVYKYSIFLIIFCTATFSQYCLGLDTSLFITVKETQNQTWSGDPKERIYDIFEWKKTVWQSLQMGELLSTFELPLKNETTLNGLYESKSYSYPGWMGETLVKVYTPFKQSDPEHWIRDKLSESYLNHAITVFRKTMSHIQYTWTKNDLEIIDSYRSSKGSYIVGFIMKAEKRDQEHQEEFFPTQEFAPNWFYITEDTGIHLGEDLYPLFANDFTGAGHSEWLMGYSGYNKQGYVLWSNDFKQSNHYLYVFH